MTTTARSWPQELQAPLDQYLAALDAWTAAKDARDKADAAHRATEYRGEDNVLRYRSSWPAKEHAQASSAFTEYERKRTQLLAAIVLHVRGANQYYTLPPGVAEHINQGGK